MSWIHVDERLPDNEQPVLVWDGSMGFIAAFGYSHDFEGLVWSRCFDAPDYLHRWDCEDLEIQDDMERKITHWHPLPLPPNKD